MLPVLKNQIAIALRNLFQTELGDHVDDLVQSLVETFAPPTLGQNEKFVAILGNAIRPATELQDELSEEHFFQIRFLIRSPFNPRQLKSSDLDNLVTGLYALARKAKQRIHGEAGIDIINAANTAIEALNGETGEFPAFHSLIRWRQTSAEPILLPSSYFGSDPIIDNPNLETAARDLKLLDPVESRYEGIAIDSFYGGVRTYG